MGRLLPGCRRGRASSRAWFGGVGAAFAEELLPGAAWALLAGTSATQRRSRGGERGEVRSVVIPR